ncbi:MAG: beta-galactosidase [Lachnospiraceae bacterium]|nr:beta-galactosidase [Lachnospiraceae bacterium]
MRWDNQVKKLPYGGDYNPEQWPEEIWDEDMALFAKAGIDTVTLNVFSWAAIQPSETEYDFSKLDKIVNLVTEHGMQIILATSTGAHPAWMAHRYPDILRVDYAGRKHKFGGRHNSCPNSPTYHKYAPLLAEKLAEHYKDQKNIIAFHISNEYGGDCYCENCEKGFRKWLKEKYGSIEAVNKAWNTTFWGHTFYDFEEIVAPNLLSEEGEWGGRCHTMFQGISLDYRRYMSDAMLDMYKMERDAIRKIVPKAAITTNLMGFYKPLDYRKWAKEMDFVSWDNYPSPTDPVEITAMCHDLMRGIKDGGSFALMEQTPSVTNWLPYNALKRPGVLRLWSYQAVAHGADSVLFFQMRRSIGACEKYHGAIIDHCGHGDTRVFREASALGEELKKLGEATMTMETKAKVAVLFDWNNWWATEYSAGPSQDLNYKEQVSKYYASLRKKNIDVDIVFPDSDLTGYQVVIAPVLYMVETGLDERIRAFVEKGGIFVTGFFSGYVQENDLVVTGGYPGKLRDILGIWVEETDAFPQDACNHFSYHGKVYPAKLLCDLIHLEGAVALDDKGYQEDFYQGMPVVTKNEFGQGKAYYVATDSDEAFRDVFLEDILAEAGIRPLLETSKEIEVTSRENETGILYYVLNHGEKAGNFDLPIDGEELLTGETLTAGKYQIEAKDVKVIRVLK